MRRILLALALYIVTASAASGQTPTRSDSPVSPKERFEFRGVHLGDTLTQKVEKELNLKCYVFLGERQCLIGMDRVAGVGETTVFKTVDERLMSVEFIFASEDFSTFLEALTARWGKPASQTSEDIQNGMGARFENIITRWQLADGAVELARYSDKITRSALTVLHDSLSQVVMQRRSAAAAEAGNKDFGKKPPR